MIDDLCPFCLLHFVFLFSQQTSKIFIFLYKDQCRSEVSSTYYIYTTSKFSSNSKLYFSNLPQLITQWWRRYIRYPSTKKNWLHYYYYDTCSWKEEKKERAGYPLIPPSRELQRSFFVDVHATLLRARRRRMLKPSTSFTMKDERFVGQEVSVKAGVVMLSMPYNLFLQSLLPEKEVVTLLLYVSPQLLQAPHLSVSLADHLWRKGLRPLTDQDTGGGERVRGPGPDSRAAF